MLRISLNACIVLFACSILLIWFEVNAIPLQHQEDTYQNDDGFHKEIKESLHEHHKRKEGLFDRILLVNKIHKKWLNKYKESKRTLDTDELINENNLNHNLKLFEGDIVKNENIEELLNTTSRKRNAAYDRRWLWNTRNVPYTIQQSLSVAAKTAIRNAIDIVHNATCIRWIPYDSTSNTAYIQFESRDGCYSTIGKNPNKAMKQEISLGEGCEHTGIVLHEMTHAMGFFHEQSRDDRADYIKIIWDNIQDGFRDQFQKYSHGEIDKLGVDYNYDSIMHYGKTAFGKGGAITIKAIDESKTIGNTIGVYTALDQLEINALYDCKTSAEGNDYSSWSPWTACDTNCNKDRQRFCFKQNKEDCPNLNHVETKTVKCVINECAVPTNGHWGRWESWGDCTTTCDDGTRQRTRLCNDPPPTNGGNSCTGVNTESGVCTNSKCNMGKYDVDFENGWGIWYIPYDSTLQWSLKTGSDSSFTGPAGDHTLQGKGHYIYVDSASPSVKGNIGSLVSNPMVLTKPHCLSFNYNMYGSRMGTLQLSVIVHNYWLKKFSMSGDQGGGWHSATVTLNITGEVQLVFEAILGGSITSDMALDDIYIDEGVCPDQVEVCDDFDYIQCGHMARQGQCTTNAVVMAEVCKKSCGKCPDKPCKNKDSVDADCPYWSCFTNQDYMFKNCKESCGICSGCTDLNDTCPLWASKGGCHNTDDKDYMHFSCKESCGLCTKTCQDDHDDCKPWALIYRDCFKNTDYMVKHCKASCGICSGCADQHEKCMTWASTGECELSPQYMKSYCKASCGLCGDCKDVDLASDCASWKTGYDYNNYVNECVENPHYMMMKCRKTCTGCV